MKMKIIEYVKEILDTCPACGGHGRIYDEECDYCDGLGLDIDEAVKLKIAIIDNIAFINTTPHPINGVFNGAEVEIPASGYLLNATTEEEEIETTNGIKFVKTVFNPSEKGINFVNNLTNGFTKKDLGVDSIIIIGSMIAVNAYPGVCGLTPMPGFERVAPSMKKMNLNKFTITE